MHGGLVMPLHHSFLLPAAVFSAHIKCLGLGFHPLCYHVRRFVVSHSEACLPQPPIGGPRIRWLIRDSPVRTNSSNIRPYRRTRSELGQRDEDILRSRSGDI